MSHTTAVVTGASQGIGRATAVSMAKDFGSPVLAAGNRDHPLETAGMVEAQGAKTLVLDLDLAEKTAAKIVVEKTLSVFVRINALVNILDAVPLIDLFEMTDEQIAAHVLKCSLAAGSTPMTQLSYSDAEYTGKRKQALTQMDQMVPWDALLTLSEPHYPRAAKVPALSAKLDTQSTLMKQQ